MPLTDQTIHSSTYRDFKNTPCDSWEIELCVGLAVKRIITPQWAHLQSLGRSLAIFKVHKEPPVCELFFMPRDEVIRTYKDKMPKSVEWVHLYQPDIEFAFWAELYQPSKKAGRGKSLLTDELCGGFGSRFGMAEHLRELVRTAEGEGPEAERTLNAIKVATSACSREECERITAQAQAKMDKKRQKKERQKEAKAERRAQQQEAEKQLQAETEAEIIASARAARLPAPPQVDFTRLFIDKPSPERLEKPLQQEG